MKKIRLTLTDSKKIVAMPKPMLIMEPARASRYQLMTSLIKQVTANNPRPKILDVGGKKGLLREFGVKSTIIDIEESDQKDYIQGDALNMPFDDNSFDVTVSCDVLEHIPKQHRTKFISEMLRVSKGFAIICAPFDQGGVAESEKSANAFYKQIAGEDHRWLIEHIDNQIPDRKLIENYLKEHKLPYQFFKHLSLGVWDITTRIHFLNAVFGDSKDIQALSKNIYQKYYDDLCLVDFSDHGYRTFCVINKKDEFTVDLPPAAEQIQAESKYRQYLAEQTLDALKGLAVTRRTEQLRNQKDHAQELASLHAQLDAKNTEITNIKNSKSYHLAQKLSKAKNFYK